MGGTQRWARHQAGKLECNPVAKLRRVPSQKLPEFPHKAGATKMRSHPGTAPSPIPKRLNTPIHSGDGLEPNWKLQRTGQMQLPPARVGLLRKTENLCSFISHDSSRAKLERLQFLTLPQSRKNPSKLDQASIRAILNRIRNGLKMTCKSH